MRTIFTTLFLVSLCVSEACADDSPNWVVVAPSIPVELSATYPGFDVSKVTRGTVLRSVPPGDLTAPKDKPLLVVLPYCIDSGCNARARAWVSPVGLANENDFRLVTEWKGKATFSFCMGDLCRNLTIHTNGSVTSRYLPYCKVVESICDPPMSVRCKPGRVDGDYCVNEYALLFARGVYWLKDDGFASDYMLIETAKGELCPVDVLNMGEQCGEG